jgi:hypothetical protein
VAFEDILYGHYAIGDYSKLTRLNFFIWGGGMVLELNFKGNMPMG